MLTLETKHFFGFNIVKKLISGVFIRVTKTYSFQSGFHLKRFDFLSRLKNINYFPLFSKKLLFDNFLSKLMLTYLNK